MDARETIAKIAETAEAVGWQAGVGASETAGWIISVLARYPEHTEGFMTQGYFYLVDQGLTGHEHGCLTFHRKDGTVTTPSELHAAREVQKIKMAVEHSHD